MAFDAILIGLYTLNFFINAANSVLAPFYPNEAISKGVSTGVIGVVFSAHPICSFFFSLALGKMMKLWGRKKILTISLILQAIGLILFGAVINFDNYAVFIAISVIARGIQGIGLGAYGSIAYAYIPLLYPDAVEKKIAMMELITGLGLMLGPLLGGALYVLGGYQCPFYVLSVVFIIASPFILSKLPSDKLVVEENEKQTLRLTSFFKNRKVMMCYILMLLPNCGISFLEPTLAKHLKEYTSSDFLISLIFSIGTLTYAATIPLINLMDKNYNKKTALIFGTLVCSISYIFLGPYSGFGLPSELWITILGLCIMGVGAAFCLVPSIPEFINLGSEIYPDEKEGVGDMASGLFKSAYSAGILIGPLVGGALDEKIGFADAEALYALVCLMVLLAYILLGDGYLGLVGFFAGKKKTEVLLENEEDDETKLKGTVDSGMKETVDSRLKDTASPIDYEQMKANSENPVENVL